MILKTYILKYFGAIALVFVLMLPASVQFSHLFEGHEHEICTEQTTHLHEDQTQCELCDFFGTAHDYTIPVAPTYTAVLLPNSKKHTTATVSFFSSKRTFKQLRAPPSIFS